MSKRQRQQPATRVEVVATTLARRIVTRALHRVEQGEQGALQAVVGLEGAVRLDGLPHAVWLPLKVLRRVDKPEMSHD